jgi:hypothetical protein
LRRLGLAGVVAEAGVAVVAGAEWPAEAGGLAAMAEAERSAGAEAERPADAEWPAGAAGLAAMKGA